MPEFEPIVITVTTAPDPDDPGRLILTIDRPTVFLSFEDEDQVRWVCNDGPMQVYFAPAKNPFDANPNTAALYQTQPGGSQVSGIIEEELLDQDPEVFKAYKYSLVVTSQDQTRVGTIDPTFKTRRRRVYHRVKSDQ